MRNFVRSFNTSAGPNGGGADGTGVVRRVKLPRAKEMQSSRPALSRSNKAGEAEFLFMFRSIASYDGQCGFLTKFIDKLLEGFPRSGCEIFLIAFAENVE